MKGKNKIFSFALALACLLGWVRGGNAAPGKTEYKGLVKSSIQYSGNIQLSQWTGSRTQSDSGGIQPTGRPDSTTTTKPSKGTLGEIKTNLSGDKKKGSGGMSGFSGEIHQGIYHPIATSEHVTVSISPASQTVVAGQSVSFQATLVVTDDTTSSLVVCLEADLPLTCTLNGFSIAAGQSKTITVQTTPNTPPGTYTLEALGLTIKNEYTERSPFTVTVTAPPPPPTASNEGWIEIEDTGVETTLLSGFYELDGTGVLAAFVDDEGNGIIDRESGSDYHVYPRIPVQNGNTWALQAGRRYEGNANLVVLARFSTWSTQTPQFLALHFRVAGGTITPVAMLAGDLVDVVSLPYNGTAKGLVMAGTSPFNFEGTGVMPTATATGILTGTAWGNVYFTTPEGFIYGNALSINFDLTVFND